MDEFLFQGVPVKDPMFCDARWSSLSHEPMSKESTKMDPEKSMIRHRDFVSSTAGLIAGLGSRA